MTKTVRCLACAGVLMTVAVALQGCGGIGQYNVAVRRSDSLEPKNIRFDIIGLNPSEIQRLSEYPVDTYWKNDDSVRSRASRTSMQFPAGSKDSTLTLPKTDAKWGEWKDRGVTHLLVVADVPDIRPTPGSTADPRRVLIPLDKARWSWKYTYVPGSELELKVLIEPDGLLLPVSPAPEKAAAPAEKPAKEKKGRGAKAEPVTSTDQPATDKPAKGKHGR